MGILTASEDNRAVGLHAACVNMPGTDRGELPDGGVDWPSSSLPQQATEPSALTGKCNRYQCWGALAKLQDRACFRHFTTIGVTDPR